MANPRTDPSQAAAEPSQPQEVIDAAWEVPVENLPAVGSPVQFFTSDKRRQWPGVEQGPYAAIVVGYGRQNSLNLYVLPCRGAMPPELYENVPALSTSDDYPSTGSGLWWRSLPYVFKKKSPA